MMKEMSEEEIADLILFYSEDYQRTHLAIDRLQAKVNNSNGKYDGMDLAMAIFRAHYLVEYKEEYKY